MLDECCASSDCAMGACYLGPISPFCGGPAMAPYNVCASDRCTTDADCGDMSVCAPAGAFGRPVATCLPASCGSDADCTASPGGRCVVYHEPCCGTPSLQCAYADGCRAASDCASGNCAVMGGRTMCSDGPIACPD